MYINGEWIAAEGSKTFDVTNPATGETIGQVADGGRAEAKAAIDAAAQAFPAWSGITAYERSAPSLPRLADHDGAQGGPRRAS